MLNDIRLFALGLLCVGTLTQGTATSLLAQEATATDPAKAKVQPLLRCTPYLQAISSTNVTVTWYTTRPAYSWVQYRETGSTNDFQTAIASTYGLKNVGNVQSITLPNLKPETEYTYEIYSREVTSIQPYKFSFGVDESLKKMGTEDLTFTTWPAKGPHNFSFVVINDLHSNNAVHKKLLFLTDVDSAEFVCYNGDIVTDQNNVEGVFKNFLDGTLDYAWQKPFFFLRGNHETRGAISRDLHTFFPTSSGQFYYTFSYGDVFFVNLDCGEDKVDTSKEYGGLVDFDSYRSQQVPWLEEVVQSPAYKKARYRIFFCHIPPAGGDDSGVTIDVRKPDGTIETSTSIEEPWHGDIEIRNKFLPILFDNKADLLICGHLHQFFNCDYNRGKKTLPVMVNDNTSGVRVDVTPEKLTMTVINKSGYVLATRSIKPRKR